MASTRLTRTNTGTITNNKKFTISFWMKRSVISAAQETVFGSYPSGTSNDYVYFPSGDQLGFFGSISGSQSVYLLTTRVFRDVSAWYHIVIAVDTTQGTAADRVKIYVNGTQETAFDQSSYPAPNVEFRLAEASNVQEIGAINNGNHFDGLLTQFIFVDGTAYDASTFGSTDSTSGEWKPNANPTVSYGNNGFKLTFEDTSNLGDDTSGNTNDFTMSGTGTSTLDNPSNAFATLNPLLQSGVGTLTNGNLSHASSSGIKHCASTLGMTTGKFYAEVKYTGGGNYNGVGIITEDAFSTTSNWYSTTNGALLYYTDVYSGGNTYGTFATPSTGDIIGIALDLDNGYMYWSNNGVWGNSGVPTSGATGTGGIATSLIGTLGSSTFFFATEQDATSGTRGADWNFGNGYFGTTAVTSAGTGASTPGTFEYNVPNGYQPLTTKGLNT